MIWYHLLHRSNLPRFGEQIWSATCRSAGNPNKYQQNFNPRGLKAWLMDLGKGYHQLKHDITFNSGNHPKNGGVTVNIGILPWQIHTVFSKATFSPVYPGRHPWCVVHSLFLLVRSCGRSTDPCTASSVKSFRLPWHGSIETCHHGAWGDDHVPFVVVAVLSLVEWLGPRWLLRKFVQDSFTSKSKRWLHMFWIVISMVMLTCRSTGYV